MQKQNKLKNFICKIIILTNILCSNVYAASGDYLNCNGDKRYKESGCNKWAFMAIEQCVAPGPSTSYFNPTILMQYKVCIFGICGCEDKELRGVGDCAWINGLRFCARGTPASMYGNNKNYVQTCGFQDSLDGMDTNPDFMPYHNNEENPNAPGYGGAIASAAFGAAAIGAASVFPGIGTIGAAIGLVVAAGIQALVSLIESHYNHVVIENHGCVPVPDAPFPPPFTSTFPILPPSPKIARICANGEQPTINNICVAGNTSFERPSARIYYDDPIKLCDANKTAQPCVIIENQPINLDDSIFAKHKDEISACSDKSSDICYTVHGSVSLNITGPKRVLYSITVIDPISKKPLPAAQTSYVYPSSKSSIVLYGINNGGYIDIDYEFNKEPIISGGSNIELGIPKTKTLLKPFAKENDKKDTADPLKKPNSFISDSFTSHITSGNSNKICIEQTTGNAKQLGCVDRVTMPKPVVTNCGGAAVCTATGKCTTKQNSCTSTNSDPKIIVGLGNPISEAIISYNSNNTNSAIYLYGKPFTGILTNENYDLPTPFNQTFNKPSGLKFEQGVYKGGATQICASGYNSPDKMLSSLNVYTMSKDKDDNNKVIYTVVPNSKYDNDINSTTRSQTQYMSETSKAISDRVYPYLPSNVKNYCSLTLPACPNGEKCCNSCNNWTSGNNLENGKCLPGYLDVVQILAASGKYDISNPPSNPSLCIDSKGNSRNLVSAKDSSTSYCNSCSSTACTEKQVDIAKSINNSYEGLRDKNPIEQGLCVSVPDLTCPAMPTTQFRINDENNCVGYHPDLPNDPDMPKTKAGDSYTGNWRCPSGKIYKVSNFPCQLDGTWNLNNNNIQQICPGFDTAKPYNDNSCVSRSKQSGGKYDFPDTIVTSSDKTITQIWDCDGGVSYKGENKCKPDGSWLNSTTITKIK